MKKAAIMAVLAVLTLSLAGCGKKEDNTEINTLTQKLEELQSTVDSLQQEVSDIRTEQESAKQTGSEDIQLGDENDNSNTPGSDNSGTGNVGTDNGSAANSSKVESSEITDDKLKAINEKIIAFEQKVEKAEVPDTDEKKMD